MSESNGTSASGIPAVLLLSDGSVFEGVGAGAEGMSAGEVVFNTSMTGYQEILTDPSYARQIVTLTYPHIGNVGCNPQDVESDGGVKAAGLVIRDLSLLPSNFRSAVSLDGYLRANKTVGIWGVDTRRLARLLRDKGSMVGCVAAGKEFVSNRAAMRQAIEDFGSMVGKDLALAYSCKEPHEFKEGRWSAATGYKEDYGESDDLRLIVAYDFGDKKNILRLLRERGCKVIVAPADYPFEKVCELKPDGVMLTNGPGDPAACSYAIETAKKLIEKKIPTFGICLGHQILGIALGGKAVKMKFGHHGANHPVKELATGRVLITSQNHGFMIDKDSLPADAEVTHVSLFDGSLQGFRLKSAPVMTFQGHPEASPGPRDAAVLFDRFARMVDEARA